ncbi:MAG: hypothetical protein JRM80_06695 [Nitrososphaerota archaeon]|nr:hypothetical protein [Nitrososphaerota archaeon]
MYLPKLLRRRLRSSLKEPTLNLAYRAAGLVLFVSCGAGALVAAYHPSLIHASPVWLAVGSGFGAVFLLAGFASAEAWEWAMSKVNYEAYASPYRRKRLLLVTGVLSLAIVGIVLLLVL